MPRRNCSTLQLILRVLGQENGDPKGTDLLPTSHSRENEIPPNWTLQQKYTGSRDLVFSSKLREISKLYFLELDRTVILFNAQGQRRRSSAKPAAATG